MSRSKWIVLVVVLAVVIGAAVVLSSGNPAPGLVDSAGFKKLQSDGVRIVDVRTAGEYAGGHIVGAENVPMGEFLNAAAALDPTAPIALYCATGSRSASAAEALASLGFEEVYDLAGGIASWDGEMAGGAGQAATTPEPSASGLPVMYEFYTDS